MRTIKRPSAYLLLATVTLVLNPFALSAFAAPPKAPNPKSTTEFGTQLNQLITNIDQSIARLRKQIVNSTNAPFLADLFLQLGELLIQKANAIYFIQSEKQGVDPGTAEGSSRTYPLVVSTQKEAAAVLDRVIHEFPKFERKPKALFLLATLEHALNDVPAFIRNVNLLTSGFPDTVYATRGRILLGMHLTDKKIYDEAQINLEIAQKSKFVFERNMAKYRLGLVFLAANQPKKALQCFEEVALDKALDDEVMPAESQALMPNRKSENLKREALLDSLRVYTTVYEKNPKPVEYYLRIAPNEALFLEIMERLAYRYIQLKRYPDAIEPLRMVGAKLADPERVVNIYRDVLQAMPPADRIKLPPEELAVLLQKVEQWFTAYGVSPSVRTQVEAFFETQLRELGTKSHDLAKAAKDPVQKADYLARAREFYLIHLRHLRRSRNSRKVATNLADVYYLEGKPLDSGEWYLRLYSGAYGALSANERREAAKSAVFVLQQPSEASYYEQTRTRGLLLRALEAYIKEDPAQARSPRVMLLLLKTKYEQNIDPKILDRLYDFAAKTRNTIYGPQAAELILDYYGTRYNLKGLSQAAKRLQTIAFKDLEFRRKLAEVERTSQFKRVEQRVIAKSGYSGSGGGKAFLQAALSSNDLTLKDAAFRQALASSRADRDIETYFKTASSLANQQTGQKKAELLLSVAAEHSRVGRLVRAFDQFSRIVFAQDLPATSRRTAFNEQYRLAVLLRDDGLLARTLRNPLAHEASEDLKKGAAQIIRDWLNQGVHLSNALMLVASESALNASPLPGEALLPVLMRKRGQLPAQIGSRIDSAMRARCAQDSHAPGCAWPQLASADLVVRNYLRTLGATAPSVAAIEPKAKEFAEVESKLRMLDRSNDPYIDLFLADRTRRLNSGLAQFLEQIGKKQPQLAAVLQGKTNESKSTAAKFLDSCHSIVQSGAVPARLLSFCDAQDPVAIGALTDSPAIALPPIRGEPTDVATVNLQKKLLADEDRMATLLSLADRYASAQAFHQAAALAQIGIAEGKGLSDELKVTLGCALIPLAQPSEAVFHLKESKSGDARRVNCLKQAIALQGGTS